MTPCLHTSRRHSTRASDTTKRTRRSLVPPARNLVRALLAGALAAASLALTIPGAPSASAHRDGCHAAHSCPSDSGSYVCGDKGISTYCPSIEALPEAAPLYDDIEPDFDAPDTPEVAASTAKAGGLVALALTAEKGSTITVQEDGRTVATKKATGSKQTITFTAPTGDHNYIVTATDAAENSSYETDAIVVTVDATKPTTTLTPHVPTALEGATRIDVNTEAGASYALAVTGQKTITATGSGATDTHLVWLRNGSYHAVVTSTDAAGNVTRVERDLRVANSSAALTVTQTSAPFHSPVEYRLEGTPRSHGTLNLPGQDPQAFDLDDTGTTTLALPLPDGSYENGTANLTDFGGRTASAALAATVVDTTAPALAFSTDAARAEDGTLAVAVTAEKAAKVTISALRRADDTDSPSAPLTSTLVGSGAAQPWSHSLEPGTYELTAAAIDAAGNQTRQTRTITITKPATVGEIAAGLGLLLVLLGPLVRFAMLLWRKREWVAAAARRGGAVAADRAHLAADSVQRRGADAVDRARQTAVSAAQAKYADAHEQAMGAVREADSRWKERRAELSELVARWSRLGDRLRR